MADIFISYASADLDTARVYAEAFEAQGHSVWWDRTIPPGRVFDEVIQEALNAAGCIVVLWSAASIKSNWVKTEASEALSRNRLVPVLIDRVLPPIEFKRIQAANLAGWNGETDHPEFAGLMLSIERLLALPSGTQGGPSPVFHDRRAIIARPRGRWVSKAAVAIGAVAVLAAVGAGGYLLGGSSGRTAPVGETNAPPSAAQPAPPANVAAAAASSGPQINLLSAENGGELLAASDESWKLTVDGDVKTYGWISFASVGKSDATFRFADGRAATFDTIAVLIPERSDRNVRQFELLAGNDGPLGRFQSVGVFTAQNMLMLTAPFQTFTFSPVTAKFAKIRPLSTQGENYSMQIYEWQLLGRVE